jgi:hypothetical protein
MPVSESILGSPKKEEKPSLSSVPGPGEDGILERLHAKI